ncbi:dipeptidase [Rhodotorula paludigena]|uniref:dipeptidase n=1 Tax=Rhodotorula paludigena TaxID=86838 RepID=UPI00317914CE
MKGLKGEQQAGSKQRHPRRRFALGLLIAVACLLSLVDRTSLDSAWDCLRACKRALTPLPLDPHERALALLERQPIIDGHIDLEILARWYFAYDLDDPKFDLRKNVTGHVDIPRLRLGKVGGFFHSVFVPCPEDAGYPSENTGNFTSPSFRVRDTVEQIDAAHRIIDRYSSTLEFTPTAAAWRRAIKRGKIGGMLGVEGGHQLGASLATLRAYYALGARYVTLTHACHSPLADSCGMQGQDLAPRWGGLSPFGRAAVQEMNRLGMMVDVSHTHPKTASDVLSLSHAPPIFSHSNARGVHPNVRNVPDSILRRIGSIDPARAPFNLSDDGERGEGWGADTGEAHLAVPSGDAIVMLNFAGMFVSEWPNDPSRGGKRADVQAMADHADYIGRLAGREHVGIGSDFDGIEDPPESLEDVAHYPNLIAELIRRGWSDQEIMGLTSGNLLRILDKVEAVAHSQRHLEPIHAVFEGRSDLVKHDKPPGH